MELVMLGTGHAMVTECYNTCFILREGASASEGAATPLQRGPGDLAEDPANKRMARNVLLVDGGGGIGLLRQLRLAGLGPTDIREVFVTHRHLDHLLGVIWLMRVWTQSMLHRGMGGHVHVFAHDEVCGILRTMATLLLNADEAALVRERIRLVELHDRVPVQAMGHVLIPFDIRSTKAKQFGFRLELDDGCWLACCGDEPLPTGLLPLVRGSAWLLHEAFCLRSEEDLYHPSRMHHSTVADACELAEAAGVANLVLYHARDDDLAHRQEAYLAEGRRYYHGNLYAPNDLDVIQLT